MNVELAPLEGREDNIFGLGMNCLTGLPAGDACVTGFVKLNPSNSFDDKRQVEVIKDSTSYSNMMSISASASASGLTWSASAAVSFVREQTGSDTCVSYIAMRVSKTQSIFADFSKATISDAAINYLKANGPSAFAAKYGTHCCIGVAYGGSFVGQIKFDAHTASDKENLATSMKGSIDAFGGSGSIDAEFSSQRSNISSTYDLTANSSIVGVEQANFNSADPDAMLAACGSLAYTRDSVRNVDGNPISFVCQTWDQFPQIVDALASKNWAGALSFDLSQGNFSQLSAEYSALAYVVGTSNSLRTSQKFALPVYDSILYNLSNGAAAGQAAIRGLTLDQINGMTQDQVAGYMLSRRMNPLLDAISHGLILLTTTCAMDYAFQPGGTFTKVLATTLDTDHEIWLGNYPHGGDRGNGPQNITFWYHLGEDPQGKYLTTHLKWADPYGPGSGDWFSNRVNVGAGDIPTATATATAAWSAYPWNLVSAALVSYP